MSVTLISLGSPPLRKTIPISDIQDFPGSLLESNLILPETAFKKKKVAGTQEIQTQFQPYQLEMVADFYHYGYWKVSHRMVNGKVPFNTEATARMLHDYLILPDSDFKVEIEEDNDEEEEDEDEGSEQEDDFTVNGSSDEEPEEEDGDDYDDYF